MVDIERRRKLALHLRHLSVGLISNDDFEDNLMDDVTNGWLINPKTAVEVSTLQYDHSKITI